MSQQESIAVCERIFEKHLGGHALMTNANHIRGSAWINFPARPVRALVAPEPRADGRCRGERAFLDRLGHQARARKRDRAWPTTCIPSRRSKTAFAKYEDARRTEVLKLQSAARNSLEWFEEVERYLDLDPVQFNYSLLTRSQRISHENLRLRDEKWLGSAEEWFQNQAGSRLATARRCWRRSSCAAWN